MMKLATRIAKLEAVKAGRSHLRIVERHVIAEASDAERHARIRAILDSATGNVLHVFRVIMEPAEAGATVQ